MESVENGRAKRLTGQPVYCILDATVEENKQFNTSALQILRSLSTEPPAGNRWFKINLHVHAEGNDPAEIIRVARENEIDILSITDHQSFAHCDAVIAAATTSGRPLTVLPGIEITSHEGVHILATFPRSFDNEGRTRLLGWLEIEGDGNTRAAAKKNLLEIFGKVRDEGGIVVVPHPFTQGIGLLDSARKLNTKTEWLESGHVNLIQIAEDKIHYVDWDEQGNWINRYVLASASEQNIKSSTYCLAPFNRSDAHKPHEVAEGCSWFRMAEPTIEGLRQVACEPRTRIARALPRDFVSDAILGVRISGGYCDGQFFRFNSALNCLVGQNYAGKSAVFDFIRYGLQVEDTVEQPIREKLLTRLHGILGPGGTVELFLNSGGSFYVVRREFNGQLVGSAANAIVQFCPDAPLAYRYDASTDSLVPSQSFRFPIEVYEQGRINRLRDDLVRQLEMLDEFADLGGLKKKRTEIVANLKASAEMLAPLYEERDRLKNEIAGVSALEQELQTKERLIPGHEEQKWAGASAFVNRIQTVQDALEAILPNIPSEAVDVENPTDLEQLFGQSVPNFEAEMVVRPELLSEWRAYAQAALQKIEKARADILAAIETLSSDCKTVQETWRQEYSAHNKVLGETLRKAGVESPQELIARVDTLRSQVRIIKNQKQPRLATISANINLKETERENLLATLAKVDAELTAKRAAKAKELTDALDGKIKIEVQASHDRTDFLRTLTDLCGRLATRESQIKNRDSQLALVVSKLSPLQLARALRNQGKLSLVESAPAIPISDICGITENTQHFLCRISDNITMLNSLETVAVPDVPQIMVQRRGESAFAELRTGLSQGEQSAAILTLALQTRSMPLIIDQPEDELGYNYVVHLIVPKILKAKFSRQILVVTHNANIPVLGDADHVIKMENRPRSSSGRTCVIAEAGCFESVGVTNALIELEGGKRAFDFRRYRYSVPSM